MKYWQEFLQFDYANEIMIGAGALFVVIGILQIVRSSIKMLFWLVFAGIGVVAGAYGMQQGSYTLPGIDKLRSANLNAIASNIDTDVLEFLCQKLDTSSATDRSASEDSPQ